MKKKIMLTIRGTQRYMEQEPEVIELVTEGTLEQLEQGWQIVYEESRLTGLEGVTTTFLVEQDRIVLTRTGALKSQMIFAVGQPHESLYQMDFGALLITVCATGIRQTLTQQGGTVDLDYHIEIEQASAGSITYHLEIDPV